VKVAVHSRNFEALGPLARQELWAPVRLDAERFFRRRRNLGLPVGSR